MYRDARIPVIRCLSRWASGWEWTGIIRYFRAVRAADKRLVSICREKPATIMHQEENMGEVELATISFGQSFQITPIQLAVTVSSLINGGRRVTPHFGTAVSDSRTSKSRRTGLSCEGRNCFCRNLRTNKRNSWKKLFRRDQEKMPGSEGYRIGGKTATSQTLPRSSCRYISSFLGFAPAEDPQVLGTVYYS